MPVYRAEFIDPWISRIVLRLRVKYIYDFLSESIKIKIYSKYLNGYGKNAKADKDEFGKCLQ